MPRCLTYACKTLSLLDTTVEHICCTAADLPTSAMVFWWPHTLPAPSHPAQCHVLYSGSWEPAALALLSSLTTLTCLEMEQAPFLPDGLSQLTGLRSLYLVDVAASMPAGEASALLNGALLQLTQVGIAPGWLAGCAGVDAAGRGRAVGWHGPCWSA